MSNQHLLVKFNEMLNGWTEQEIRQLYDFDFDKVNKMVLEKQTVTGESRSSEICTPMEGTADQKLSEQNEKNVQMFSSLLEALHVDCEFDFKPLEIALMEYRKTNKLDNSANLTPNPENDSLSSKPDERDLGEKQELKFTIPNDLLMKLDKLKPVGKPTDQELKEVVDKIKMITTMLLKKHTVNVESTSMESTADQKLSEQSEKLIASIFEALLVNGEYDFKSLEHGLTESRKELKQRSIKPNLKSGVSTSEKEVVSDLTQDTKDSSTATKNECTNSVGAYCGGMELD